MCCSMSIVLCAIHTMGYMEIMVSLLMCVGFIVMLDVLSSRRQCPHHHVSKYCVHYPQSSLQTLLLGSSIIFYLLMLVPLWWKSCTKFLQEILRDLQCSYHNFPQFKRVHHEWSLAKCTVLLCWSSPLWLSLQYCPTHHVVFCAIIALLHM